MHQSKRELKQLKNLFLLGQIVVFLAALTMVFIVMVFGYRQKVLHRLLSKLDTSCETMADQLKANQVPLSSTGEHGVFIISQNDGSMVIDRHNDNQIDGELWSSYRTKLIYEMQKQKRGWIVYPDKQWWDLNQTQKIIRYIPVDQLGWILALEVPRPTEMEIFKEVVSPFIVLLLLSISITGVVLLWIMTQRYFVVFRRHISKSMESNLMSLGGEEKVWEEIPVAAPKPDNGLENEAIGLGVQNESQLPLQKTVMEREKAIIKEDQPLKRDEEPPKAVQEESKIDQLTVNVNDITSPVLKKMIQQFRNK